VSYRVNIKVCDFYTTVTAVNTLYHQVFIITNHESPKFPRLIKNRGRERRRWWRQIL